ncbi:DUF6207 family protein [Streptomyces sp. NPDC085946]|uniref:DUF6207 family protein n=1 Tax=Streptomyces sp. NPDC085946 TaxID=3365744 RepID=UPI0037D131E7
MTAIDDLLARAALLKNPRIPGDTVPYLRTCSDLPLPPAGNAAVLAGDVLADNTAAHHLRSLCEVAVTHTSAPQITDFITEQLPTPEGAWILGCLLHLAGVEEGARYWWQYAAGAGDRGASYCLSLHHRARGDDHAADFWLDQAGDDTDTDEACETSTATVLRIVAQMTASSDRTYSDTTLAIMSYTTAAVTDGYRRHPDIEIPAPGPYFAEILQVILATITDPHDDCPGPPPGPLPARPLEDDDTTTRRTDTPEPDHVLVQLAAPDAECASAFHAAVAHAWRKIPPEQPPKPGQREVLMRFLLDRRHLHTPGLARARDATEQSPLRFAP